MTEQCIRSPDSAIVVSDFERGPGTKVASRIAPRHFPGRDEAVRGGAERKEPSQFGQATHVYVETVVTSVR